MKFKSMIKLKGGYAPITIITEARDPFEARRIIQAQYKDCSFWSYPSQTN